MLLKNLEYEMTCRFSQPNDYMDLEEDMLIAIGAVTAGTSFVSELSHNILLGLATLSNPGYVARFVDTDDQTYTSSVTQADFYETETHLISEAQIVNTISIASDIFIKSAEVLFDRGGGQELLSVVRSTQLQNSSFASYDGTTLRGLKVESAGGDLTILTTFRFTVVK